MTLEIYRESIEIPLRRWVQQSEILKNALFQKKISDFFSANASSL